MEISITRRQISFILIQLFFLLVSFIVALFALNTDSNYSLYISLSSYGTMISVLLSVMLIVLQKRIATIPNLFFLAFVLFQFGMPITYALWPNHYNYYFELFNIDIHVNALVYSLLAIHVFCISLTIGLLGKKNKRKDPGNAGAIILNHPKTVTRAAFVLFLITTIFVVPIHLHSAISALLAQKSGITISNQFRGAMSTNGWFRFAQEFFFPSALLFACFSSKKNLKRIVWALYLSVAAMMVIEADRNAGITAFIVFAFYLNQTDKNRRKGKSIAAIAVIALLGVLSSFVAMNRLSGTGMKDFLNGEIIFRILDEMGFNYTSICFIMDYIPRLDSFKLGLSYIAAIVLLVPKSFDFLGLYPTMQSLQGETWLWAANNTFGRPQLSFGVGFSMIAESYYNFAWYGLFVMIPLGFIIAYFLHEREKNDNPWRQYIRLALMLGFFTLPRRQFASMIKSLEYSVFFMMLFLLFFIIITDRKHEMAIKKAQNGGYVTQ